MTLVDNAEAEIEKSESIVTLFFARWCPFCRAFKPSFEDLASSSGGDFGEVTARRDGKPHVGLSESDLKGLMEEI
ncbi:MAG: hypothetical protein KAU99_01165 [Thermoplasmata archaeon]|nr:hypothetical protein [Thermoplasmata archaeon]